MAGEPRELPELSEPEEPVNHCLHPLHPTGWAGDHSGCSGLPARSLQRVPELPKPNSALNKDSKQDPQGSITGPWPSHLQPLPLSGPEPGCLRHPLGSYMPVKATWLPQSTQRPLLYHAIFSNRERQPFCVIHINKHRKSSKVKR